VTDFVQSTYGSKADNSSSNHVSTTIMRFSYSLWTLKSPPTLLVHHLSRLFNATDTGWALILQNDHVTLAMNKSNGIIDLVVFDGISILLSITPQPSDPTLMRTMRPSRMATIREVMSELRDRQWYRLVWAAVWRNDHESA